MFLSLEALSVGAYSSEPSFGAGVCGHCGDYLTTQMHRDAGGPCEGAPIRRGANLPHVSESVRVSSPLHVSLGARAARILMVPTPGDKAREGISSDGCCLGCGDPMSTMMHVLKGGPCRD